MSIIFLAACSGGSPATPGSTSQPGGLDDFLHPPTKSPTATLVPPGEVDLSGKLDAKGAAVEALKLEAPDGCMWLDVEPGTQVLTTAGAPLQRLTIAQDYPGKLPMEAYGVSISYAYRFGPEEIYFSQPVRMTFTCLKNMKKTMIFEISVGIKGDDDAWDQISVQGDETSVWTRLETLLPATRYLLVGPAPMGS